MVYYARNRARFKGVNGLVNIPYGTRLISDSNGMIFQNNSPICRYNSQNAIDHFVRDDDGLGAKRAELVNTIESTLEKVDINYQKRWDKVQADDICNSLRRKDYEDYWLWDRSFYDASIFILEHIAGLVTKED